MTVDEFQGRIDPYPVGTVLKWGGSLSDIPPGWVYCDGNNGTADLRNTFLQSVPDTATNPGTTGGENSKVLATGQLPAHNHSVSTGNQGNHNHSVSASNQNASGNYKNVYNTNTASNDQSLRSSGSHSHGITTNNTGSGNAIDNRPAYVETPFIKKI